MRQALALLVVLAVFAVTACGGDDEEAPTASNRQPNAVPWSSTSTG